MTVLFSVWKRDVSDRVDVLCNLILNLDKTYGSDITIP
ncbi:hypothetical protein MC7420_8130 [Coleofasciculus chthonoplastes PCC 7420]|uniref:Uncharacterized protein n=1 Tax=Coleofasciculus chthonoplastes PCC 7420 TaxID=118168 RepID=B4W529_9CYAN|nr:hypothetical protein MC7420_8130 [Coleofasciculus chthonoplastes PCC 7420]